MKRVKTILLISSMMLFMASVVNAQAPARVQIIHNSADAAASTVDVWLNDALDPALDDFDFREATPFIDAPSNVPIDVTIQPANSADTTNGIYRETFTFMPGETYVVVASGIVSGSGYSPATPFSLEVFDMGREASNNGMGETDVLVLHGSTDAPAVDVYESSVPAGTLVDNAAYGDFASYLELTTANYELQIRNEQNSAIVAAYSAPLADLNLGGAALTVLASGFLDPSQNSNGPAFGLYVALASGGQLVELPSAPIPTARVQVIHNSADAAAATVDVWLNDGVLADDFAFRTATPYVDAQAGVPFDVSIAAPNSTDTVGAIARFTYTLEAGETYQLIANGIVSGTGYTPAMPFDIDVYDMARESAATSGNVDVLVYHGATDAPTVDIEEIAAGAGIIVPAISYSEFQGYLELASADYALNVLAGGSVVATFAAPLTTLDPADDALTILASGFLDPSVNSNGAAFGLYLALPSGGDLVALDLITSAPEVEVALNEVSIYPNPSTGWIQIELGEANGTLIELVDLTGKTAATIQMNGENRVAANLSELPKGMYLMKIFSEEGTTVRKVVLE